MDKSTKNMEICHITEKASKVIIL